MADILVSTLNAKFIHSAFGLRYLMANLGTLQSQARLIEFDIHQKPLDIVEVLLQENPRIVGLGVYIWNVTETTAVVAALKRVRPDIRVIIGGPEVSFEIESQEIVRLADYVITGEADLKFAEVCQAILSGNPPAAKVIPAELPDLARLKLPYSFYDERDVAHRIIYVEASRGCPFTCEFCLSSLDIPVRQFPLAPLLEQLQSLLDRGVTQFKFVDRTFNLNLQTSRAILEFFQERYRPGLFVHFEMIPDRLPEALRAIIARFPPGALQFEVGIQTFDEAVSRNISRRQDYTRLADNFRFLREQSGVHIHADLIVGLPGESVESFAAGFDRLVNLRPQEIQVGILKRLRGTPIVRHDLDWEMIYNSQPPYEILQNKLIDYATMQQLRRFSRHWDLIANSGNFLETAPLIWKEERSAFGAFLRWSEWLFGRTGRTHGIALVQLAAYLFEYLTTEKKLDPKLVASSLSRDYARGGRSDVPIFLRPHVCGDRTAKAARKDFPKRQARHLASVVESRSAGAKVGHEIGP
ncbi:MAG: radical SAM protein [Verrucomicrobiota bacterium]